MEARLAQGVRRRADSFGGVCYVPSRDDFFAADNDFFGLIRSLDHNWVEVTEVNRDAVTKLAQLGICETTTPTIRQEAYSGPSFLGRFVDLPTVSEPLVVNCFCTAHCPLLCLYCHANDLMATFRASEEDQDLDNVAATASMIPALVAVITGGDPLTKPERAAFLIERLAAQKAIVLDTSGVGAIEELMPLLKRFQVHVRVSLDSVSSVNDAVRPANPAYAKGRGSSRLGAEATIKKCIAAGVAVTVQTVISARNESHSELTDLRDMLIRWGVRHWVLHVAVKAGSARAIEDMATTQKRRRGILPSPDVYARILRMIRDTAELSPSLDIRVTDNDTTPNSVLLVGSKGDLFTEGLAHNGKVPLYRASERRPDKVHSLWYYVDRFGHSRRYLNWHPWLADGSDLEELCVGSTRPPSAGSAPAATETEAKFPVFNRGELIAQLRERGFDAQQEVLQRDEYFDSQEKALTRLDFVVRLRHEDSACTVGVKGPRFFSSQGDYSRVELEFLAASKEQVYSQLDRMNLKASWILEKRRVSFTSQNEHVSLALDEVPEVGSFLEIEGHAEAIQDLRDSLLGLIGPPERRNYAELFRAYKQTRGVVETEITGATFSD